MSPAGGAGVRGAGSALTAGSLPHLLLGLGEGLARTVFSVTGRPAAASAKSRLTAVPTRVSNFDSSGTWGSGAALEESTERSTASSLSRGFACWALSTGETEP